MTPDRAALSLRASAILCGPTTPGRDRGARGDRAGSLVSDAEYARLLADEEEADAGGDDDDA